MRQRERSTAWDVGRAHETALSGRSAVWERRAGRWPGHDEGNTTPSACGVTLHGSDLAAGSTAKLTVDLEAVTNLMADLVPDTLAKLAVNSNSMWLADTMADLAEVY
jgi:hypothetical protein